MNKEQAKQYIRLCDTLAEYGLNENEVDALLRCERTLQRWAERECGDGSDWAIERDDSGKPWNVYHGPGTGGTRRYPIADREAGALARAGKIAAAHGLTAYHQGDCRGCMLYVLRPGDIPENGKPDQYYNRGLAVTIE